MRRFLCACLLPFAQVGAQLSDPLPAPIAYGDLTVELEDWVTLPASSGGGGGRARLSVMRYLSDGRLFVNDQRGLIYEVEKGRSALYFDVRSQLSAFIDQPGLGTGLHAFAFHPDFLSNGKLYTVHSERWNSGTADLKGPIAPVNSGGQMSVVSEWTTNDPAAATFSGTRRELLRVYFPGTIHCAQEIAFNPTATAGDADYGLLYICLGEGGGYLKGLWQNEHRLDSPMGTVLRIDPMGNDSANGQYGIPPGNPWAATTDASILREIYAYGFRNPHRINWDTGGSHRAYIGDIGERQLEELNLLVPGGDYGFPQREGTFRLDPTKPNENTSVYPLPGDDASYGFTYPVAQYDHDEGFAIAGGPVYRGSLAPALVGKVLFGDIPWGRIFVVEEADLALGTQAPISEVRLTVNGAEGELRDFVRNSRADLRWGMDAAGEVYVMTKTDGKIRRIVGATDALEGFDNDPERWEAVADFSAGETFPVITRQGDSTRIRRVGDPFGDGSNQVLAIEGSDGEFALDLPTVAAGDRGSVYFRFALGNETSASQFILENPALYVVGTVTGSFLGNGLVALENGGRARPLSTALRPGIWYDAWIVFTEAGGTFNFYLRGDRWTAPSLLLTGATPDYDLSAGVSALIWGTTGAATDASTLYLDDVMVDRTASNTSVPVAPNWLLVSNFEHAGTMGEWRYRETDGPAWQSFPWDTTGVVSELSGNHYFEVGARAGFSGRSHARIPLPRRIEVSENVTLYARMRIDDFATNQVWGLVNVAADEVFSLGYDAYDAIGRWTDENGSPQLLVRDDAFYQPAAGTYAAGRWYEAWLVARNGGEASGGQTFDLYTRVEASGEAPALVYSDAGFRLARETPFEFFQIIANNGSGGKTGTVRYDDLFLFPGVNLDAPAGTGYGLLPGPRGEKSLPWFGSLWDDHFPWIYHLRHGWLYLASEDPGGTWVYDRSLGWMWMAPEAYPYFYVHGRGEWVYYLAPTHRPRWFYGFVSGEWFSAPKG